MAQFKPERETCPICGSAGNCHIHHYYGRSIIDFKAGRQEKSDLCILRVFCDSCRHAHAILPDIIIPYSSHSLFFILRLLGEYFAGLFTIEQLCSILGVPDRGGKTTMFRAIQEQIAYLYKEKHQPLLLAIDEAQYLNTGILNDIKMLMNYGYDSVNCFTLILCGESHLNDTLRKPVLPPQSLIRRQWQPSTALPGAIRASLTT